MSSYVCGDLHGRLDLLRAVLNWLQPNDILYTVGDFCDRGPDGWQIYRTVLADQRIHPILGNHEEMMLNACLYNDDISQDAWLDNGGSTTLNQMLNDPNAEAILSAINDWPVLIQTKNTRGQTIIISHSGFTPQTSDFFNTVSDNECLWNRYHFDDAWDENQFPNIVMFHGHTPIELMVKEYTIDGKQRCPRTGIDPLWYANGHKCNVDVGAVWTNMITLVDIDTFQSFIITPEEE